MRFSFNRHWPGANGRQFRRRTIHLDGAPQRAVVAFDVELGEVVRLVLTADGRPQIDPVEKTKPLAETVRGRVEIV